MPRSVWRDSPCSQAPASRWRCRRTDRDANAECVPSRAAEEQALDEVTTPAFGEILVSSYSSSLLQPPPPRRTPRHFRHSTYDAKALSVCVDGRTGESLAPTPSSVPPSTAPPVPSAVAFRGRPGSGSSDKSSSLANWSSGSRRSETRLAVASKYSSKDSVCTWILSIFDRMLASIAREVVLEALQRLPRAVLLLKPVFFSQRDGRGSPSRSVPPKTRRVCVLLKPYSNPTQTLAKEAHRVWVYGIG
jgi:hypothetical protein